MLTDEQLKSIEESSRKLYEGSIVLNGKVYILSDNLDQYLKDRIAV